MSNTHPFLRRAWDNVCSLCGKPLEAHAPDDGSVSPQPKESSGSQRATPGVTDEPLEEALDRIVHTLAITGSYKDAGQLVISDGSVNRAKQALLLIVEREKQKVIDAVLENEKPYRLYTEAEVERERRLAQIEELKKQNTEVLEVEKFGGGWISEDIAEFVKHLHEFNNDRIAELQEQLNKKEGSE